MKIYMQDHGWAGMLVVVAGSEDEARELLKNEYTYSEKDDLQEFEITNGLVLANYGDT